MSKARVKFTAEDKKEIAKLINEAKQIQGTSNASLARNTGFAESTIGRAVYGTSDTMDGVYIAIMKELGITYTPANLFFMENRAQKSCVRRSKARWLHSNMDIHRSRSRRMR